MTALAHNHYLEETIQHWKHISPVIHDPQISTWSLSRQFALCTSYIYDANILLITSPSRDPSCWLVLRVI